MTIAQPLWLLLLPLLLLAGNRWRKHRSDIVLGLSQTSAAYRTASLRGWLRQWLPVLRWAALGLLVLAMARPQRAWKEDKVKADSVDIMLAIDLSPSMLSRDFDPDRISVAKRVAIDFVEKRPYDRLGLVAFAAEAFTQCPLTTDRKVVQQFIRSLEIGRLSDGTAIGMGLSTAVNRLKDSPSKSKLVILLTDGENNAGYITPMQAAEIAKTLGIRVYTVGIGTEGVVISPAQRNLNGTYSFAPRYTDFDTKLLEDIAELTRGRFYRAYSEKDLEGIYEQIDKLEKTRIDITTIRHTAEMYHWFAGAAILLLLLELLLRWGLLRAVTI
jgi:Ca-activated chloride channel family protein